MNGSVISVEGTFTKTVGDGTGEIDITPATNDEITLMYGRVHAGAVKATAAYLSIYIENSAGDYLGRIFSYSVAATEAALVPGIGTKGQAAHNFTHFGSALQLLIYGTDKLNINLGSMKYATSEVFEVRLRFRSKLGRAPTVAATGGTWT